MNPTKPVSNRINMFNNLYHKSIIALTFKKISPMVLVVSNGQKMTFTPCNFPKKTTGKKHLWTGLPSFCQSSLSPGAARQCNKHVLPKKKHGSKWSKSPPLKGKTNLPNICLGGFHVHFPRSNLDLFHASWICFKWPGDSLHELNFGGRRHLIYLTSSHDFAKLDEIWIMSRCRSSKIQETMIVLGCFGALLGYRNGNWWTYRHPQCKSIM